MAFFIKTPPDNSVKYHGKILPQDAAPAAIPDVDPTVNYAGKKLPQQAQLPNLAPPDQTNNPSLVQVGGITLPPDVIILLNGEKIIAISKILDGVAVTEHIGREPYEVEFEFTYRTSNDNGVTYIFPQDAIDNVWTNVWTPNSVQPLVNTYLNKLGISQLIIRKVHNSTVRGSKNVPARMTCIENVSGTSLILNT